MQRVDQLHIRIDSLVCSEGFEQRLGQPHVVKLAASIKAHGLIHPPVVREDTLEVVAGEDRIAAHVLLNRDVVLCDVVECRDDEVLAMREAENRDRRTYTGAQILEMVEQKTKTLLPPPMVEEPEEESHVGRKKLDRTKAIEAVAAETGLTKDAARKRVERAKKKDEHAEEPGTVFETWGREVDPTLLAETSEARRALTEAAGKVSAAIGALTRLQGKALIRDSLAGALAEQLRGAGVALRAARPAALCPWCKGQADLRKGCAACLGAAYVLEANMDNIPAELKDPRAVMVGGRPEKLPSVVPAEPGQPESWTMQNGTTIEFELSDEIDPGAADGAAVIEAVIDQEIVDTWGEFEAVRPDSIFPEADDEAGDTEVSW